MRQCVKSNFFRSLKKTGYALPVYPAMIAFLLITLILHTSSLAREPNFIVILLDDLGYADLGCYGSGSAPGVTPWKYWDTIPISTPRIDKMASEGVRFTSFYSGCQVCTPSRAALLTGCYPKRVGLPGVIGPTNQGGLNPNEITLADLLKARGYATGIFGKWHLGHTSMFLPCNNGFDYYYGIPYSNDMRLDPDAKLASDIVLREGWTMSQVLELKNKTVDELNTLLKHKVGLMRHDSVIEFPADQSTLTRRYTDEAISFIKKNSTSPFFVYIPHTMPHIPLFASSQFAGTTKRGSYGDVVAEIDWNVGRLLDSLKSSGLDDNTFVVFTSDNGPWLSTNINGGTAYPLRDGKFSNFEGGFRVPCIMRWPGKIPAGVVQNEFAALIDIYPTIAKLSATSCQKLPAGRIIDGVDIWSLISGTSGAKRSLDAFYYDQGCIRVGTWKYIETPAPGGLFNLATDIHEDKNVAASNQAIAADLKAKLASFTTSLQANKRPSGKPSEGIQKAGCMDKTALNYNTAAQIDDGSCRYCATPVVQKKAQNSGANGDLSLRFDNDSRTITAAFTRENTAQANRTVTFRLFDASGSLVRTMTTCQHAGDQTVRWDLGNLPAGLFMAEVKVHTGALVKPIYIQ